MRGIMSEIRRQFDPACEAFVRSALGDNFDLLVQTMLVLAVPPIFVVTNPPPGARSKSELSSRVHSGTGRYMERLSAYPKTSPRRVFGRCGTR